MNFADLSVIALEAVPLLPSRSSKRGEVRNGKVDVETQIGLVTVTFAETTRIRSCRASYSATYKLDGKRIKAEALCAALAE